MEETIKPPLLFIKNISKKYQDRQVVNSIDLNVRPGEIVGLLGPNGAGKTTAFYITMGLIPQDSGEIYFQQENISKSPIYERAKKGMGYLSQEPSVFRTMTVEDNIRCVLETLNLSADEQEDRLDSLLDELSLSPLRKVRSSKLSGGERRKLEITRSLVLNPSLLLLDEPFANVDPITIYEVKKMISHLKAKGISVLITDHNAREILSIVDRSYLMSQGKILAEGRVDELLENPEVRSLYLGEQFTL